VVLCKVSVGIVVEEELLAGLDVLASLEDDVLGSVAHPHLAAKVGRGFAVVDETRLVADEPGVDVLAVACEVVEVLGLPAMLPDVLMKNLDNFSDVDAYELVLLDVVGRVDAQPCLWDC
jgi:hypothetical protein